MALDSDGWGEWRSLVLRTLERLEQKVDSNSEELANVKAAARVWSSITALIVSPIVVGIILAALAAFT